jgi:hypothetical protein
VSRALCSDKQLNSQHSALSRHGASRKLSKRQESGRSHIRRISLSYVSRLLRPQHPMTSVSVSKNPDRITVSRNYPAGDVAVLESK